jgi:uncharacterized protein (PEP-CTERM system associated)
MRLHALAAAAVMAMAPALALAQSQTQSSASPPPPPAMVTIEAGVTATDNGALAAKGLERADLILSLRPHLELVRRRAGLELDVDAAVTMLDYARDSREGGVLPEIGASLRSTIVERWLYLDAAARVRQSEADPFGTRADDALGANRRTQGSYSISPYLEREFMPDTTMAARLDAAVTTNGAGDGSQLRSNHTLLRLERKPVPWGASLEWSRLDNETRGAVESRFTLDTLRARATANVGHDLVLGLVAGSDRSQLLLSRDHDTLYGASAHWSPGPRTELATTVEHRFFGNSGELKLRHRMPFMSLVVSAGRQPMMSQASLGVLGQGADLRGMLDAILTTRYPDPVARTELVNSLVANLGLNSRGAQAVELVAEYPQLQTAGSATLVLLGSRNTLSVSAYVQTQKRLQRPDEVLLVPTTADNRQWGANVQFNRRLTPQLSADLQLRYSKIRGLADRAAELSQEGAVRLALMQNVAARSSVSAGVQYNRFSTNVSGQHPYRATQAFIGMNHRF